jgi:hypothetical protein
MTVLVTVTGLITVTGDHDRPVWLITINGIYNDDVQSSASG